MEQALGILFAVVIVGGIGYLLYTKVWKKKGDSQSGPPPTTPSGRPGSV